MTLRLTTNYAKNYCNRTLIVKVIVENVVTCFWGGHGVVFCDLIVTVRNSDGVIPNGGLRYMHEDMKIVRLSTNMSLCLGER